MKKALLLSLVVSMMMSAMPTAYAADTHDYNQGTQVEYVANADANRAYTITVPAKMIPKLGQEVTGIVVLEGTWASNETVIVTADPSVTLKNNINESDTHTLAVNLTKMEYTGDDTESKRHEGTVTLAEMPAAALFGTWFGQFNYNVDFVSSTAQTHTPLKFDEQYICTIDTHTLNSPDDNDDMIELSLLGIDLTLFEDGGATMFGGLVSYPAGTLTYTQTEIQGPDGLTIAISNDGKTLTQTLEYGVQVFTHESEVTFITFSIDGVSDTAIEGMTWYEWVNCGYNAGATRFEMAGDDINSGIISYDGKMVVNTENGSLVYGNDLVIANHDYKLAN